jgi:septum formation inhibitor MinC
VGAWRKARVPGAVNHPLTVSTQFINQFESSEIGETSCPASFADVEPPERGTAPAKPTARNKEAVSLLIENPMRSRQSVDLIESDVTVLGSVGSGAEIITGESIQIYGTPRCQATVGAGGSAQAWPEGDMLKISAMN